MQYMEVNMQCKFDITILDSCEIAKVKSIRLISQLAKMRFI
jgi:hypothetical protein